jgi:tetratricopeptide (TPR) repeat protein
LHLARELGDTSGVAITLNNLGLVAHLQGDYTSAGSLYAESLALKRELGDKRGIAITLCNLGLVAHEQGDNASASIHFEESLILRRDLGDKWGIALSLAGLGAVAVALGSVDNVSGSGISRGVRLLGFVEALLESIGGVLETEDRLPFDCAVVSARALLGANEFERLWAQGHTMTLEQALEYALQPNQP